MAMDIKALAVFLPLLSALLYGLTYAMNEKVVATVSVSTYVFISYVMGAFAVVLLHFMTPWKIDFARITEMPTAGYITVSVVAATAAWLLMLVATREISATYAAIGEISYPFFTALFTYLIFRERELDTSMTIGGLLILAGSVIVITDKIKVGG